ncbi:rolling circle replication-associated protein, partial [Staphylococcus microti]|uniref:rolling circle replication-associated protein n=5 Tax=Staphylococcus TaxID=1279 RepID=UPI001981EBAF
KKALGSSSYLSEDERLDNQRRYMFKVKTKIKDLVLNNHFDMFWTLTFDPKKCIESVEDEYRFFEMRKWLDKMRKRHSRKSDKPFMYIAIPERHKSGLIHWHMVTGNLEPNLIDSGKTYKKQKIYNCIDWEHGFSNVQMMRSKSKISSYVTKYITKDLLNTPARKNKRKYWSSNNLTLPTVYGVSDDSVMSFMHDEYDRVVEPNYSTDVCDIWVFRVR